MNETTNTPDPDYNPDLDPTPEDGEITPRDELIIELDNLRNMDAADFNFWRNDRFGRFEDLIRDGVEGDGTIFLPAPEPPPMPTGYDDQGFSLETSSNCVQHENFRTLGELCAKSGNRILEYLGAMVLPFQWYLLPVDRFDGDEEFQLSYLKNATCTPHASMTIRGRSGFVNKPVYANITGEIVEISGREVPKFRGFDPIDDHHQPITGTNMDELKANIEALFLDRFALDGPGWYGYVGHASNSIFNQDRHYEEQWEHYQPPARGMEFARREEEAQALDQLKALQRHID